VEIAKRVHGEGDPVTLFHMSNLAEIYFGQGRLDEAEEICLRILETQKKVRGEDHLEIVNTLVMMSDIYYRQGRLSEVRGLGVKISEIEKRGFGEENHNSAAIMVGQTTL
jgi:hypothetical protein